MEHGDHTQRQFAKVLSPEDTNKLERIKEALTETNVFCGGNISFPRFNPWKGLLEILAETRTEAGTRNASITFNKGDCTLNNNGLMPDPLCWGMWNPVAIVFQIVKAHCPALTIKILPKQPQAEKPGCRGKLLHLRA